MTVTAETPLAFHSLNLSPADFSLTAGQSRSFTLKPGRYVITSPEAQTITCSDSSPQEHNLSAGESISCTFSSTP